jgi:hypothetical protein
MDSPESRSLLLKLSSGQPDALRTIDARAALLRLGLQPK